MYINQKNVNLNKVINMRNVMLLSDSGVEIPYEYNDDVNPKSKKFTKTIFRNKGIIECFPFLNLIKEYYNTIDPTSPILEKLNQYNDEFNIWIIFNRIVDDPKPWQINNFLSKIFNADIYAENICMFVSQDELNNGKIDVSQVEYERFSSSVIEISKIALQKTSNEYLNGLKIFIDNHNIISLDGKDVVDFQNEYFGKAQSTDFTELIELQNGNIILRKNGAILCIDDTYAEFYFISSHSIDNIFKEILC